jgi:hypothetical protein
VSAIKVNQGEFDTPDYKHPLPRSGCVARLQIGLHVYRLCRLWTASPSPSSIPIHGWLYGNVAEGIVRLGHTVRFLGALGDDEGGSRGIRKAGVDTSRIQIKADSGQPPVSSPLTARSRDSCTGRFGAI